MSKKEIPSWVYEELEVFKNTSSKLEERLVVVGDSCDEGEDLTQYINSSEYVFRFNPGVSITTQKLGHKTDILGLSRDYFTPFDYSTYAFDYNSFFLKQSLKESREVWLLIEEYLLNEDFLEKEDFGFDLSLLTKSLINKSWDFKPNRDVLYFYVRHLYAHYKLNIKMLSHEEFWSLLQDLNFPSKIHPIISFYKMASIDSRFKHYDITICNFNPTTPYENGWYEKHNDIFI